MIRAVRSEETMWGYRQGEQQSIQNALILLASLL
jgi:hypothetical protein